MPHIIIEHQKDATQELDLNLISKTLHNYLAEHDTVNKAAIKTRTISLDNVYVGEDSNSNKMLHITILLLSGRSQELKEKIVSNIYSKTLSLLKRDDYTLSVETRDLGVYFKG